MPESLRVAFVTGSTPDKWAKRWRERSKVPLELIPIEESEQGSALTGGTADMVLARLPVRGIEDWDLHVVRLYEELPVVVVGLEHPVAAYDEIDWSDLVDEQFPLGVPRGLEVRADQLAWPTMSAKDAIEVAASGTGVVVVPQSIARLFRRKDVVVVPLTGPAPTHVGLAWLRERDDALTQEFVGVARGRGINSSR